MTFTVTSGGSFTARVNYDGLWRMFGWSGVDGPTWDVAGVLSLTGGTAPVDDVGFRFNPDFDFNADTAASLGADPLFFNRSIGTVAGLLTSSILAQEGDRVTVAFELSASIGRNTRGMVDFSDSAFLSVAFSDGLFAIPDDQRFLSFDARNPAVIPLPAAGWLLLAGIGTLATLRRRKQAA